MANKMIYTARDIVEEMVGTFLECGARWTSEDHLGTDDTLEFIKEKCERFNLDENIVKELFDDCQHPFYYDLETKEIVNGDESDDDEPVMEVIVPKSAIDALCEKCEDSNCCTKDELICGMCCELLKCDEFSQNCGECSKPMCMNCDNDELYSAKHKQNVCSDCDGAHPPYYCNGGCGKKMGEGNDHGCKRICDECWVCECEVDNICNLGVSCGKCATKLNCYNYNGDDDLCSECE